MPNFLVLQAEPNWLERATDLPPGSFVVLLSHDEIPCVQARCAGLYLRDTLLILRSELQPGFAFLLRKPTKEDSTLSQVMASGTGSLHIGLMHNAEGTVLAGRWPANVLLVHAPTCRHIGQRVIGAGRERVKPHGEAKPFDDNKGWNNHSMTRSGQYAPSSYGEEVVEQYDCADTCAVRTLNLHADGVAHFYRQFETEAALLDWLRYLVKPPCDPKTVGRCKRGP